MAPLLLLCLFLWVCVQDFCVVYGDDGTQRKSLSICEYVGLKVGTELADAYNLYDVDHDWNHRMYQDYIVKNLGFAPWMAQGIGGKTVEGNDAKQLHNDAGWVGHSADESPYKSINHKWIYMFGDSTTRQVWASFAAPFKGNSFERNAKEWTRHYCNKQEHRHRHGNSGTFDEEGWRGPCGKNEVTCHISGYGDRGVLTFDWKHFPFEDYDEYLWSESGPWIAGFSGEGQRRPDLLTIQTGMHTCWHAIPEGLYSRHLNTTNEAMIDNHIRDLLKLFKSVRTALDAPVKGTTQFRSNATTVIILTSGNTGLGMDGLKTDACIQRFNRAVVDAAHLYGFAVLDRGEIERRLVQKSLFAAHATIPIEMHLIQPAQNIVATSLLRTFECLLAKEVSRSRVAGDSDMSYPLKIDAKGIDASMARPLHTPPG